MILELELKLYKSFWRQNLAIWINFIHILRHMCLYEKMVKIHFIYTFNKVQKWLWIWTLKGYDVYLRLETLKCWCFTGCFLFCPPFVSSPSSSSSASNSKYSVTVHKGSGQPQEAKLIGSSWMSMSMCDQSHTPRAFPSPHLAAAAADTCVSNRSNPRLSAVSTHLLTVASCQMC